MRQVAHGLCAVMVVAAVAGCDGNGDETAVTTEVPATAAVMAFDPQSDDLCRWVTGVEIVEFMNAAGANVEGPATVTEPNLEDATGWNCAWTLVSGEEIHLGAVSYSTVRPEIADNYEGPGQVMDPAGAPVLGHPDLSDGVVVENRAFGRFSFYVPGTDHQLNVLIVDDYSQAYETVVMGTAEAVLGELGWLHG